jgi:hypothetical protein
MLDGEHNTGAGYPLEYLNAIQIYITYSESCLHARNIKSV